jgi:hypothetical protein
MEEPMLYIVRLTNGNCVILLAPDEQSARCAAKEMDDEIASIRAIESFRVQLCPTEDGTLEILHWDDSVLDCILKSEYPLLHHAYREANARPFEKPDADQPAILRLNAEFERNTEIMRQAVRLERQRFGPRADGAHGH